MDYIRVQSTPYFSWDFDFKSDFGPVKLPGLSRNMPQGSSTIKCVQTMRYKARDSDSKYALLLLLCRHIGLLFSRWLDSNLLRHRTWNYPGSSVHKLPDSLRIFCFVVFFTLESGFQNIRIRWRIRRMRVCGTEAVSGKKSCGFKNIWISVDGTWGPGQTPYFTWAEPNSTN